MTEYQMSLSHEIEDRLKVKCDRLAEAFADDIGKNSVSLICLHPTTHKSLIYCSNQIHAVINI